MLSLRIVAGGAVFLFVSGAAVSGVAAQTATTDTPGKPLELLRIIEQPVRSKALTHSRLHTAIHRSLAVTSKRHSVIAKAQKSQPTVQDTAAVNSSEDSNQTPATRVAASEPTPSPSEPVMGRLIVGNPAVAVASQSDVNDIG